MPIDPGRTTRQVPPHPGDDHAAQIRTALQRLDGSTASAVSLPIRNAYPSQYDLAEEATR